MGRKSPVPGAWRWVVLGWGSFGAKCCQSGPCPPTESPGPERSPRRFLCITSRQMNCEKGNDQLPRLKGLSFIVKSRRRSRSRVYALGELEWGGGTVKRRSAGGSIIFTTAKDSQRAIPACWKPFLFYFRSAHKTRYRSGHWRSSRFRRPFGQEPGDTETAKQNRFFSNADTVAAKLPKVLEDGTRRNWKSGTQSRRCEGQKKPSWPLGCQAPDTTSIFLATLAHFYQKKNHFFSPITCVNNTQGHTSVKGCCTKGGNEGRLALSTGCFHFFRRIRLAKLFEICVIALDLPAFFLQCRSKHHN